MMRLCLMQMEMLLKLIQVMFIHQELQQKLVHGPKSNDQMAIILDSKENRYIRVVLDNGNYYIETGEAHGVGYKDSEIIFTGSDLDQLISNIKGESTTTSSTTSFVSGKIIVAKMMLKVNSTGRFYADGTYSESGFEDDLHIIVMVNGKIVVVIKLLQLVIQMQNQMEYLMIMK